MRIFSILVEVIKGNGTFSIHSFVHSTIFVKTHYVPGGIHGTGDKNKRKTKSLTSEILLYGGDRVNKHIKCQ